MKNWFRDYGPMLIRNGYRIVAVDDSKRPVDKGWQEKVITHHDCAMRDRPCGIGIQTGAGRLPVYAFDVDVDDKAVAEEFGAIFSEKMGALEKPMRIGGEPRFAIFFRMQEEGLPSISESKNTYSNGKDKVAVGVRGDRQQMVAYGVHHIENKGEPDEKEVLYTWPNDFMGAEPLQLKVEDLPLLTVEERDEYLEAFGRIAKKHGYVTPSRETRVNTPSSRPVEDPDIDESISNAKVTLPFEQAREVLYGSGLGADDYDTWVKVGMALATSYEKSQEAFELWNDWSSSSDKYSGPADLLKHWRSFRTEGENLVTMGWVVYHYRMLHADDCNIDRRAICGLVREMLRPTLLKVKGGDKAWWLFNGTHWERGYDEEACCALRAALEHKLESMRDSLPVDDEKALERVVKEVARYRSNSSQYLREVKEFYKTSDPSLIVKEEEFDKSLRYIGVKNGDIDLETLELVAPAADRKISKVVDVEYDPTADCPTWRRVVQDCLSDKLKGTDGREEYEYFQRLVGYALTGSMGEDVIALLWGGGSNGKTLIMRTIREVLGVYATQMQTNTLVSAVERSISGASARPDIMALKGSRLAMCEELPDNGVLDSATAKMLASCSTIAARSLFKEVVTFDTSATVLIGTNYLPRLTETGNGIVRRLRVFHFPNKYEVDARLPSQLEKEKAGIFNWILEGLRKYRAVGLGTETTSMQEAKSNWIKDEDCVGTWADDRLVAEEGHEIKFSELAADYRTWARSHSAPTKSSRSIRENLEARGYRVATKGLRERWLVGYKLKEFEEWV